MAIDPTIPLNLHNPAPMKPLSDLLNVRQAQQGLQIQQQQMQSNAMKNQQDQIDLQERQGVQQLMQDPKQFQDDAGNFDMNRFVPAILKVAPTTGTKYVQNAVQMQTAGTDAKNSLNSLADSQRASFAKIVTSFADQPPETLMNWLESAKKSPQFAGIAPAIDFAKQYILGPAASQADPAAWQKAVYAVGKQAEAPKSQQDMSTPGGVIVDNGQEFKQVSTKPGTTVDPGKAIPGTEGSHQIPPTTPVLGPDNGTRLYGTQAQDGPAVFMLSGDPIRDAGALNTIANSPDIDPAIRAQARAKLANLQQQGNLRTALPPGQAENMTNNVQEMGRHFANLQDAASSQQLVEGLTGNIKALASRAVTGTESDKIAYAVGLLDQFHIAHGQISDLKTATDLLEKNMAQLTLGSPARSDAAQALVAAARPHSGMSKEAISEAADQIASQAKANTAMRNVLQAYKLMGDAEGYQKARSQLEQVADPRAWQYQSLGPGTPAAREFLKKLTPQDRADLGQKIHRLEQMGILK